MKISQARISAAYRATAMIAPCAGTLAAGQVTAGSLLAYEVGTADVGLASAGYGARAQDASTVVTNPAGMTRLEEGQFLGAGQLFRGNTNFSIGSGGWFPGGGFLSYSVSPDLKLGFAISATPPRSTPSTASRNGT